MQVVHSGSMQRIRRFSRTRPAWCHIACAIGFLTALACGTGADAQQPDPRFTPEAQAQTLVELWQSTCLKYYRNPLALGAFLLKSGYLKNPPHSASFLRGEPGSVWDVSTSVHSQRALMLLDNGICEIHAQVASTAIVKQAFTLAIDTIGDAGAVIKRTRNEQTQNLGHDAYEIMYSVTHPDDRSQWVFGASGTDNPLAKTQAILLISRQNVRSGAPDGSAGPPAVTVGNLQNSALTTIFENLQKTTTRDNARQIEEAIGSSETLRVKINELAEANLFSGFKVVPRAMLKKEDGRAGIFGGFIQGREIVFSTELLKELKNDRLSHVTFVDDVLPNNMLFALSHLVYHLGHPLNPNDYANPAAFSAAALRDESAAFIEAWNTTMRTAQQKNKSQPLSPRQIAQLLTNLRYRFAFMKALEQKEVSLVVLLSGEIESNDGNLRAIADALKHSSIADLQ